MIIVDSIPQTYLLDQARLLDNSHPANCYEELANAIVLQAVKDYRAALRGQGCCWKSAEHTVMECEEFFRSEYYRILTKLDGEMLISKLQEEYYDESNTNTTTP